MLSNARYVPRSVHGDAVPSRLRAKRTHERMPTLESALQSLHCDRTPANGTHQVCPMAGHFAIIAHPGDDAGWLPYPPLCPFSPLVLSTLPSSWYFEICNPSTMSRTPWTCKSCTAPMYCRDSASAPGLPDSYQAWRRAFGESTAGYR